MVEPHETTAPVTLEKPSPTRREPVVQEETGTETEEFEFIETPIYDLLLGQYEERLKGP